MSETRGRGKKEQGEDMLEGQARRYSTRRVLVTGGAGFLGSHLCEKLLARGDEVLCADNFFTGTKVYGDPLVHPQREECTGARR